MEGLCTEVSTKGLEMTDPNGIRWTLPVDWDMTPESPNVCRRLFVDKRIVFEPEPSVMKVEDPGATPGTRSEGPSFRMYGVRWYWRQTPLCSFRSLCCARDPPGR